MEAQKGRWMTHLSGADRAVALIIVDVCISVNFLIQRCPATMLQTSSGKYVCLCSWPTCKHGKCGCFNFILYLSRKYFATVHSTVCPFSNCNGNLRENRNLWIGINNETDGLVVRWGEYIRLHLSWTPCYVAYTVFSSHCSAMCDFDF